MSTSQSALMLCCWGVKAGMVHSTCGCTCTVGVKLCDPLLTHAIPEHLRDEQLIMKHTIQPRLPMYKLNVLVDVSKGTWAVKLC